MQFHSLCLSRPTSMLRYYRVKLTENCENQAIKFHAVMHRATACYFQTQSDRFDREPDTVIECTKITQKPSQITVIALRKISMRATPEN
jgi:hypothetical protein